MDWWLIGAVFLLVMIGLATLYSIGANGDLSYIDKFYKQAIFAGIGVVAFFIFTLLDARIFTTYARFFGIVSIGLLAAVLVFGTTFNGTTGWFVIGPLSIQPVEIAKVLMVMYLAAYVSSKPGRAKSWQALAYSGLIAGVSVGLVVLQPDLGSAIILLGIWLGMIFVGDVKPLKFALILGALALVATLAWGFVLEPYQQDRLLTFVQPERDPLGSGYNVKQAVISVGSGGLFGRGLGLGTQSQLNFLPAQETDFVFAVISESLGFMGAGLVLVLFGVVFWRMWLVMIKLKDDFGVLVIAGIFWILVIQLLINVGMNMGIMPVTGIPLPFISSGGSSLVMYLAAMGIVQSFVVRQKAGLLSRS